MAQHDTRRSNRGLTPTEEDIFSILRDGEWHDLDELMDCLPDEQASVKALQVHIYNMKPKLERKALTIAGRHGGYRLVRLLANPYNGTL